MNWASLPALSTRWPSVFKTWWAPNAGFCWISRTNCVRRLARLGVAVELARSGENRDAALDRIQKESDRLNALVGELLQATRAEVDPQALRAQPVRLDELLWNDCE